jgi:two-component system KDP operon response regulator KdpE
MSRNRPTDHPPEILLIEDDAQIRKFLRTTFAAENYALREASTAAQGLSQAAENPPDVDKVVTHSQLLNKVWGPDHEDQVQYLRVYMLQLRRKLEADPTEPRYLRTESGIGYRLTTEFVQDS